MQDGAPSMTQSEEWEQDICLSLEKIFRAFTKSELGKILQLSKSEVKALKKTKLVEMAVQSAFVVHLEEIASPRSDADS